MSEETKPRSMWDYHLRFPAVVSLAAMMFGIGLGWQCSVPMVYMLGGGAGMLLLSAVCLGISKLRPLVAGPLVLFVLIIGIWKITFDGKTRPENCIESLANDTLLVRLTGIVSERPTFREGRISFSLDAENVTAADSNGKSIAAANPVEGGVSVLGYSDSSGAGRWSQIHEGQRVVLIGELGQLPAPRNPGEFDYGRYLRLHGVYAKFVADSDTDFVIRDENALTGSSRMMAGLRRYLSTTIDSIADGEEANLLRGLILGERTDLSPGVKEAFMNSGLMHILAVSGFNVGLVVMILAALFSISRLRNYAAFIAMGIGLLLFGLMTGAQASVMRAVVMALVFLGGRLLERRADMYNTLAVAALLLLLIDARTLFDAGFQLSFLAVAGLAFFYPRLEAASQRVPKRIRRSFAWELTVASIAVTLAATFGTLPLTMFYFHKISIVGIALNLVAVPLSSVILALGFAAMVGGLISLSVAQLFGLPAVLLSHWLLELTVVGSRVSWAYAEVHAGIWLCVSVGAALVYIASGKGVSVLGRTALCAVLAGNLVLADSVHTMLHPSLEVTFLDVGQGDAAIIRTPGGKTLLIDCGPASEVTDAGERVIAPFLKSAGVKSVDEMIISHPHRDHIGGARYIFHTVPVRGEVDAGIPSTAVSVISFYREIGASTTIRAEDSAGCVVIPEPGIRLYILHPSGHFRPSRGQVEGGINNQSLVVKVVFGATSILFSGDAQEEAENRITSLYGDFLGSDILKVGHHGSFNATSERYLQSVHPKNAVISVGQYNQFGHPAPETITKLARSGVSTHRTDLESAVVFRSDGSQWRDVDWK